MRKILILIIGMFLLFPALAFSLTIDDPYLLTFLKMDEASGTLSDSSTGSPTFDWTVGGTPVYRQHAIGHGEYSIDFDGSTDYFENDIAKDIGQYMYSTDTNYVNLTIGVHYVLDTIVSSSNDRIFTFRNGDSPNGWSGGWMHAGASLSGTGCSGGAARAGSIIGLTGTNWRCADDAGIATGEHICAVMKVNKTSSAGGISFYNNGSLVTYTEGTMLTDFLPYEAILGATTSAGDEGVDGRLSYFAVWNRSLTDLEVSDYCTTGIGVTPPPPIPIPITTFTLTGTDTYNGSALENITVFITNSSFSFSQSTSNGTIILLNSSFTFNSTYDIKFASNQSGGYLNHSFNINITERGSFQGDLFQSRVIVNAKEVITNDTILSFTTSVPLQSNSSNSTGQSVLLLKAGSYDLIGDAAGYMLRGFNFTVNPKQEINVNITLGTANLTVTALSSAGAVNDFNTTMTLLSTGFSETIETNTGTAVFPAIPGFFNVTINSADWTFDHKTITITAEDTLPNITFNLFSKNSINITIFDEETNEIIDYTTTTLIMDHISQKFTNTTGSGNVFFIELFDGLWDLLISTAFHNQREYIFTIVPQTTSRLNVYLLNSSNGDLTTFNIKNKEDQTLPGSTISVSNKINNTFVTVAQSVSDFAGQSNIFLSSTNEYRFTIEADTFTTKVFNLVPLANAYDIIMDPVDAVDFTTIYDVLSYTIIPASILAPQQEQNISFITSSPLGYISYFGLNSSFNSTTNRITNVSGSLAGGTASIFINTTDHTGTHIPVDFFIKIAGEPEIRIHHSYRTSLFITPGNISSVSIADKYKDSFTNVGKSLIIVIGAVAVILSLAEAGAPALANGIAGAIVIIFGVIIGWISPAVGIIITFITVTMVIFRRAD